MRVPHAPTASQRGVALVVALILLVVITLIGLAAVGGTIMQGKMAANQYDRQTAFQNAASALRVAKKNLLLNPNLQAVTCVNQACSSNPFTTLAAGSAYIHTVATGTSAGTYTASALATGQPQYVIEKLGGFWPNPIGSPSANQSTNCHQYGGCPPPPGNATYYRITARSGNPATIGNRAIVTLQTVVMQY